MAGLTEFRACVLAHRRLSVLDLSDAAKQPMATPDGRVTTVFNGEIYNFREIRSRLEAKGYSFRTTSDTEVLPALYEEYGTGMVDHLNGMFAFAIWDTAEERLVLARDRMGKKPLYYYRKGGRLAFASELPSLVRDESVPREVSDQALFEYLLYDFIPAPHTIFSGVYKLPAAHLAVFDADGLTVDRYWNPPEPSAGFDFRTCVEELESLLEDAVRTRLISDVPLGAFLSGGVDSSLVTALMQRAGSQRTKTFSIAFPGASHDESPWSRLAARHLGTDHREYPVDYAIESTFPEVVRGFGEPFGDSSAIPTRLLSEHTRRHVTVALSGDGGDELFAGYERYLARKLQIVYEVIPSAVRRYVIEPVIDRLPATTDYYGTSLSKKLKLFAASCRRIADEPSALAPRTFSRAEVVDLLGADYSIDGDPVIEAARRRIGLDPISAMTFTDMETYMAEDILTKVDRMSMTYALEVRSPLLDYRVVEFACRLPVSFKLRGRTTKRILKEVAGRVLPRAIVARPKYGFQVPLGAWLKAGLKEWASERLFDSSKRIVNHAAIDRLWKDHQAGRADNAHKIWLILVLNEWLDQSRRDG